MRSYCQWQTLWGYQNNNNNNIYDLYRAYTGGSMRHYNDKKKQYIKLEVK